MALRIRIGLLVAAVAVAIPSIWLTAGQQRGASGGPFVQLAEILVTFRPGTAANASADIPSTGRRAAPRRTHTNAGAWGTRRGR